LIEAECHRKNINNNFFTARAGSREGRKDIPGETLRLPAFAVNPQKWLFFYILWLKIYPYKKFIPLVLRLIAGNV
jgi:hypothetical protein